MRDFIVRYLANLILGVSSLLISATMLMPLCVLTYLTLFTNTTWMLGLIAYILLLVTAVITYSQSDE